MQTTLETITEILIDQLGYPDNHNISPSTHLANDLGADSLDQVEIIMAIEDHYEIEIPDDAASEIHTVADLHACVEKLIA